MAEGGIREDDHDLIKELAVIKDTERTDLNVHTDRCGLRFRLLAGLSVGNRRRMEQMERRLLCALAIFALVILFGKDKALELAMKWFGA